ncbi:MAG: GntR family transcriptional regulator [Gemmatimonadaceae bacterium]
MAIDPGAAMPLYQQVALDIRRKIASGEMPVGSQLQPHREMAVSYGVSMMTINKALSGLVSEGLLHSRVGRGTFVAQRPTENEAGAATLGFVLRDLSSPFFSLVAHAAQQRADELGYGLLFSSSSNRLDREEEQIRRFMNLGVRGLIIASMSRTYRINEPIQELHNAGFPYVMVSYTAGDDIPFIGMDLNSAGYLAAKHLIEHGRTRIGYIGDKFGSIMCELRGRGYRRALEQAALPVDADFQYEYPFEGEWNDYRSGYAVAERVANSEKKPDAMFVFNDLGALGFLDGLLDRGIQVPDDIAVVGLDDIELAGRARIPLTTVRQPVDRIGALAVDHILARLRGERPQIRQLLPPELIVRKSSGAAMPDEEDGSRFNPKQEDNPNRAATIAADA